MMSKSFTDLQLSWQSNPPRPSPRTFSPSLKFSIHTHSLTEHERRNNIIV